MGGQAHLRVSGSIRFDSPRRMLIRSRNTAAAPPTTVGGSVFVQARTVL